ncbi:Wadjet anti-phage system protein JetD domain-containing protein [Phytoactinopolyspora limicola]|uniref:Wadjet anti-phage system protein JetD domain-containing protein n=1 Tax=Phytoactinopolyspora limicola TaxID=2715536 RepID=UPI00140DEBCB|nr:DUF3322 and DUF2220 domain-containing protein [Phytoactinopolyspora limicola]
MNRPWTTPADIRTRVQRRWSDGSVLRAYAAGEEFPRIEVPLRGPKPSEIGDALGAVQAWVADLEAGRRNNRFSLNYTAVGGRLIGRNMIPSRAIVSSYQQTWSLLGVADEVRRFEEVLALVDGSKVREWVLAHPLKAIALADEWPGLLSAYKWLDSARGSGVYLREISAPGVDTKFVERHRTLLASFLGIPGSANGFLASLGLRAKPEFVRLRTAPSLGLYPPLSELSARVDELPELDLKVGTAVVIENEVTYLTMPVPADGVVLWGKGFDVHRIGALRWLSSAEVFYWGDLDTHGFAILNQLRAWLPHARSFLMDRETLLAHRDRWVTEHSPTAAQLEHLTPDEADLYADLVSDRYGERIRLEQERIDWVWASDHMPAGGA